MSRIVALVAIAVFAGVAQAQVIYLPPPPSPTQPGPQEKAQMLLRAISRPVTINVQVNTAEPRPAPMIGPAYVPPDAGTLPDGSGYFRKADLLPPPAPRDTAPAPRDPATRPGTIRITPDAPSHPTARAE